MLKMLLLAGVAIAASLTFPADHADAFGGRGYARRQARRAHYAPAAVVVQRSYAVPVVSYYRAPVYYPTPVPVSIGRFGSYHGSSHHHFSHPFYGRGISMGIGW